MARGEDQSNRVHSTHMASASHAQGQLTETLKSVAVLNGGGAVAMLAFIQAMVGKEPEFHCYKSYGLGALAAFIAGALFVSFAFFARWQAANAYIHDSVDGERVWTIRMVFLLLLSTAFFFLACGLAGFGIAKM